VLIEEVCVCHEVSVLEGRMLPVPASSVGHPPVCHTQVLCWECCHSVVHVMMKNIVLYSGIMQLTSCCSMLPCVTGCVLLDLAYSRPAPRCTVSRECQMLGFVSADGFAWCRTVGAFVHACDSVHRWSTGLRILQARSMLGVAWWLAAFTRFGKRCVEAAPSFCRGVV
jgi:hypothetical protein